MPKRKRKPKTQENPPSPQEAEEKKEANLYDKIFKEVMGDLVFTVLARYGISDVKKVSRVPDKMQTTTEREPDFLCKITEATGYQYLLHVEFQSGDDPQMIYREQEYHGIAARKYELPIRHFVLYFGNKPSAMATRLPAEQVFTGFELVDFKTIDYRELLERGVGKEIVLAILANFGDTPPEVVIEDIIKRLKEVSQSERELKIYFKQLIVLARLRNLAGEVTKTAHDMPVTIDIKKDYFYNKGVEAGELKGKIEGKIEGELQGKLIATLEDDLKLLVRMSAQELDYGMMRKLSDVPDALLEGFRTAYTADKGERLLAHVHQAHELSGLGIIQQHLLDGLLDFGITRETASAYIYGGAGEDGLDAPYEGAQ